MKLVSKFTKLGEGDCQSWAFKRIGLQKYGDTFLDSLTDVAGIPELKNVDRSEIQCLDLACFSNQSHGDEINHFGIVARVRENDVEIFSRCGHRGNLYQHTPKEVNYGEHLFYFRKNGTE